MKQHVVYIAAPFFSEEQIERVNFIERVCKANKINYFSPMRFLKLKPDAHEGDRLAAFNENVHRMKSSSVILACVDDKDTGTVWEMGYGYGKGIAVVAFSLNSKTINLMLANGCSGFLQNEKDVKTFLKGKETGYQEKDASGMWWDFNWEVARKWNKNIY